MLRSFLNRTDIVAIQIEKDNKLVPHPLHLDLDDNLDELLAAHRAGEERVGSYAPNNQGMTRWACFDIDGEGHTDRVADPDAVLDEVLDFVVELGFKPMVEVSGSGTGYHVWILFEGFVPAGLLRELLTPLVRKGLELYPKSATPKRVGNLVWLPKWGQSCPLFAPDGTEINSESDLVRNTPFAGASNYTPPVSTDAPSGSNGSRRELARKIPPPLNKTRDALMSIDPDLEYADWVGILAALRSDYGDDRGRELALEWSKSGDKWDGEESFNTHWFSFEPMGYGGKRSASIIWLAKEEYDWNAEKVEAEAVIDEHDRMLLPASTSDLDIAEMALWNLSLSGSIMGAEGSVWQFDGRRWATVDDDYIMSEVNRLNGEYVGDKPFRVSSNKLHNVEKIGYRLIGKSDPWPEIVPGASFRNGFLGPTGLVPHEEDQHCRFLIDADFDPEGEPRRFLAFLDSCFKDCDGPEREARKDCIQEFFGAALMGESTRFDKVMLFKGPGGSGKSTCLKVFESLMPRETVSHIQPQKVGDPNEARLLIGSRLNVVYELDVTNFRQTAQFKSAVSGEWVSAKYLYNDTFQFRPQAGWLIAGNLFVKSRDVSSGFFRRWVIVPFESVPDNPDRSLISKLLLERTQIFSWAYRGYQRLKARGAHGSYTLPDGHHSTLKEWRHTVDPITDFMSYAERSSDGTKSSDLYRAYKVWCSKNGVNPITHAEFSMTVKQMGFPKFRKSDGSYFAVSIEGVIGRR